MSYVSALGAPIAPPHERSRTIGRSPMRRRARIDWFPIRCELGSISSIFIPSPWYADGRALHTASSGAAIVARAATASAAVGSVTVSPGPVETLVVAAGGGGLGSPRVALPHPPAAAMTETVRPVARMEKRRVDVACMSLLRRRLE